MQQPGHTYKRVDQANPCPVCGVSKWCEIRDDGVVHCMRVESPYECDYRQNGWLHYRINADGPAVVSSTRQASDASDVVRADPRTIHDVYSALLNVCPLIPSHRQQFGRGPISRAARQRYGSLPWRRDQRWGVLETLEQQFSPSTLLRVPGFYARDDGAIDLNARNGILIPVRDFDQQIIALRVRNLIATNGSRYYYLSSAKFGGPTLRQQAHVARPYRYRRVIENVDTSLVWVTEGEKKADVVADVLSVVALSMGGLGTWRLITEQLEEWVTATGRVPQPQAIVIALDEEDPAAREKVERVDGVRHQLANDVAAAGYAVRFARWDHADGKGIDDLLDRGLKPRIKRLSLLPNDAYTARRLAAYEEIALSSRLEQREKAVLSAVLARYGIYPGLSDPSDRRCVTMNEIMEAASYSRNRVGDSLRTLRSMGILRYESVRIRMEDSDRYSTEMHLSAGDRSVDQL